MIYKIGYIFENSFKQLLRMSHKIMSSIVLFFLFLLAFFFYHLSDFVVQHTKMVKRDLLEDVATIQVFSTKLMLLSVVNGMCMFVFLLFLIGTISYAIRIFTQMIYQDKEEFFTMCALGQNRNVVCLEFMLPYMYLVLMVSVLGCGVSWQIFVRFIADFSELFAIKSESLSFAYQKNGLFFIFIFSYLSIRLFLKIRKVCNKI